MTKKIYAEIENLVQQECPGCRPVRKNFVNNIKKTNTPKCLGIILLLADNTVIKNRTVAMAQILTTGDLKGSIVNHF